MDSASPATQDTQFKETTVSSALPVPLIRTAKTSPILPIPSVLIAIVDTLSTAKENVNKRMLNAIPVIVRVTALLATQDTKSVELTVFLVLLLLPLLTVRLTALLESVVHAIQDFTLTVLLASSLIPTARPTLNR